MSGMQQSINRRCEHSDRIFGRVQSCPAPKAYTTRKPSLSYRADWAPDSGILSRQYNNLIAIFLYDT